MKVTEGKKKSILRTVVWTSILAIILLLLTKQFVMSLIINTLKSERKNEAMHENNMIMRCDTIFSNSKHQWLREYKYIMEIIDDKVQEPVKVFEFAPTMVAATEQFIYYSDGQELCRYSLEDKTTQRINIPNNLEIETLTSHKNTVFMIDSTNNVQVCTDDSSEIKRMEDDEKNKLVKVEDDNVTWEYAIDNSIFVDSYRYNLKLIDNQLIAYMETPMGEMKQYEIPSDTLKGHTFIDVDDFYVANNKIYAISRAHQNQSDIEECLVEIDILNQKTTVLYVEQNFETILHYDVDTKEIYLYEEFAVSKLNLETNIKEELKRFAPKHMCYYYVDNNSLYLIENYSEDYQTEQFEKPVNFDGGEEELKELKEEFNELQDMKHQCYNFYKLS